MRSLKPLFSLIILLVLFWSCNKKTETFSPPVTEEVDDTTVPEVLQRLTTENKNFLFEEYNGIKAFKPEVTTTIKVNPSSLYQELTGFGFAITGGTADHLSRMSDQARNALLNELFGNTEDAIGLSAVRISIGASDLSSKVYSYNDLPAGTTDVEQSSFSIEEELNSLIPILKEILEINPTLTIFASPWSAPSWMKDNNSSIGGSLKPEYYASYALYFRKYIEQMLMEGINIDYITVQNEPLHAGNNPSMYMTAADQKVFVRDHLGPELSNANINTKILIYDHNVDKPEYPMEILEDDLAASYVAGSAYHLYAGNISALSVVRNKFPSKEIHFTEQWYGAPSNFSEDLKWHIREVIIGSQRNWSKSVIEWNLTSNQSLDPHTPGGCDRCLGAITVNNDQVERNAGYYVMAHVSKFVKPGAVRVFSNQLDDLPNVAFTSSNGELILIVLNNSSDQKTFNVVADSIQFNSVLDAGSVSTYVLSLNQ